MAAAGPDLVTTLLGKKLTSGMLGKAPPKSLTRAGSLPSGTAADRRQGPPKGALSPQKLSGDLLAMWQAKTLGG